MTVFLTSDLSGYIFFNQDGKRKFCLSDPRVILDMSTAYDCRYMFGLPSDSVGLLMLLDKGPHVRSWRYLQNTQIGE